MLPAPSVFRAPHSGWTFLAQTLEGTLQPTHQFKAGRLKRATGIVIPVSELMLTRRPVRELVEACRRYNSENGKRINRKCQRTRKEDRNR